jgi:hypothetical protein
MNHLYFGFKRHTVPLPWALFRRIGAAKSANTSRTFGNLDEDQRRVHHFVVRELPGYAKPMEPDFVARKLSMELSRVIAIMDELERRKLFLFRPGGRDVAWAYPVTVEPTPHRVTFSSGESIYAA